MIGNLFGGTGIAPGSVIRAFRQVGIVGLEGAGLGEGGFGFLGVTEGVVKALGCVGMLEARERRGSFGSRAVMQSS
jgi:hypothetical protein